MGALTVKSNDVGGPNVNMTTVYRVARKRQIPRLVPATVLVPTDGSSLMFLTPQENDSRRKLAMRAWGEMKVVSKRPFYVPVRNFSKQPITFHKGMILARAATLPDQWVDLRLEERKF